MEDIGNTWFLSTPWCIISRCVKSMYFKECKSGCPEVSWIRGKKWKYWSLFSTSVSSSSLLEVHFELCCWIAHILPVLLSSNEVSVQVSGQCWEVVSHFSYCFSWISPAGQMRGISPECIIYSSLIDDGFTVSWWKWNTHPSYHLFGGCTLEKRCVCKIIVSLYLAYFELQGLQTAYITIIILN